MYIFSIYKFCNLFSKCVILNKRERRDDMKRSKVYFTKEITPQALVMIYRTLGNSLEGNIAVKVHSGEPGGSNFLKPEFMRELVDYVDGTIVECNTAYDGKRDHTDDHLKVMETHGFTQYFDVDIMDQDGEMELVIPNGKQIHVNYVGDHLKNYDGMIVLSHFKGHMMGGFGGALKNLSIGVASRKGKGWIHGAGDLNHIWDCEQDKFLEAMADAASSVQDYMKDHLVFISAMVNLSIDCDCESNPSKPEIPDIGLLASLDPVALDQACVDLVYQLEDPKKESLIHRIEEKHGKHILESAEALGMGSRTYEFIQL